MAKVKQITHIESGVPLPPSGTGKHWLKNKVYFWEDMQVGDSIFSKAPCQTLLVSAKGFADRHRLDWKFTTRKEEDGARIWRIQ